MIERLRAASPACTIDQFLHMVDAGEFVGETRQVELIRQELVTMSPASAEHGDVTDWFTRWSVQATEEDRFTIRIQSELAIASLQSVVEPDIMWLLSGNFRKDYPTPRHVALLIEVAVTSPAYDRGPKAELYAEAGIRDYWLVDVPNQTLEVRREPVGRAYRSTLVLSSGDHASPLCQPSTRLEIADLFRST